MHLHIDGNATLTIALALAAGMLGQAVAVHLRVPGILLLLVIGAALGPDVANLVQPASLGEGLNGLVGFAVAVILFEGGMTLDLRRLRREELAIRRLITVGALVSLAAGAALVAIACQWEWQRSVLFGTLVVVTGPTVVTPLVRRVGVQKRIATILEAEGVLIDAVGAITAAVALELVLRPSGETFALAAPSIVGRLAFGAAFGAIGGAVLALLLRWRRVIPEGLENPFALGWAVLVFQLANAAVHESGIAAVTIAGLVVGNARIHVGRELAEFKEQLTKMLIGMLFVLLVADVRFADVLALGTPGVVVAIGIICVVRPLSVALSTIGTSLDRRERAFIAWMGPRGIVAAAVASLFGYELEAEGIAGGDALRALVFLVIAATVLFCSLTSGLAATRLGVRRKAGAGWVILGGHALGRELAARLGDGTLVVDHDERLVRACEDAGLPALQANAFEPETIEAAQLETRRGTLALTSNDEVNLLFAQIARRTMRGARHLVTLRTKASGVSLEQLHEQGAEMAFGASVDVDAWSRKIERGEARVEWWRFAGARGGPGLSTGERWTDRYAPLLHRRGGAAEPIAHAPRIDKRSEVAFVVDEAAREAVTAMLRAAGWLHAGEERASSGRRTAA